MDLAQVLRSLPSTSSEHVLVGLGDDASVVRVNDDIAIVETVDFISPVVNDPYQFGRIAAANALSDIYAMGATPSFALNIAGFPLQTLPIGYLQDIMRGGADMLSEVGIPIVGGHTYEDHAPKYGLTVTGFVHPDKFVTKRGAQDGDALVLTKPLGVGVITTAIDQGVASQGTVDRAIAVMTALNDKASQVMVRVGVHACTDVTGYGLLGHLLEMVRDDEVVAEVEFSRVPVLDEALPLVQPSNLSRGTKNNRQMIHEFATWHKDITEEQKWILCDAQTSGGLLIAVSQEKSKRLLEELSQAGCTTANIIGHIHRRSERKIPLLVSP